MTRELSFDSQWLGHHLSKRDLCVIHASCFGAEFCLALKDGKMDGLFFNFLIVQFLAAISVSFRLLAAVVLKVTHQTLLSFLKEITYSEVQVASSFVGALFRLQVAGQSQVSRC